MSILVHRIINPPKSSNCFVVSTDAGNQCLIIDPGAEDCDELLRCLDKENLRPEYVLLTHEHIDHIAGCQLLFERFGCLLIGTSDCQQYGQNPRYNLTLYQEDYSILDHLPPFKYAFNGSLNFDWQGLAVKCIEAKGHSYGSMLIIIGNHFFTGDTIVKGVKTTTNLPGGNKKETIKTLEMMKSLLNDSMYIHGGHLDDFSYTEAIKHINGQIEYMQERINRRNG